MAQIEIQCYCHGWQHYFQGSVHLCAADLQHNSEEFNERKLNKAWAMTQKYYKDRIFPEKIFQWCSFKDILKEGTHERKGVGVVSLCFHLILFTTSRFQWASGVWLSNFNRSSAEKLIFGHSHMQNQVETFLSRSW